MDTGAISSCTLTLTAEEREVLIDILEDALKMTEIEEHRTDALHAKQVVRSRERAIESLLRKARAGKLS
jgi:hypothetical protein